MASLKVFFLAFFIGIVAGDITVEIKQSDVPNTRYLQNAVADLKLQYSTSVSLTVAAERLAKKTSERYLLQTWHVAINPLTYYFRYKKMMTLHVNETNPHEPDRPASQTWVLFQT